MDNINRWLISIPLGFIFLLLIFLLVGLNDVNGMKMGNDSLKEPFVHEVIFNHEYDISELNDTLYDDNFTVDVVLFFSDHLNITWENFQEEFLTADKAFRKVGVQLHLKKAVNVSFPAAWNNQVALDVTALPDSGQTMAFYDKFSVEKTVLTKQMEKVFYDFVYDEENKDRTIFVLPISGLKLVFAEQSPDGNWQVSQPYPTGAMSYPPYLLHDRVPKDLRGVITQQKSSSSRRTLAHEMGHKLINVSHEGLNRSPAFGGSTIPGLLGYGSSLEIYSGEAGRWHKERLLKSPFLYKIVKGEKVWNEDYKENGKYNDPIYGNFIVSD